MGPSTVLTPYGLMRDCQVLLPGSLMLLLLLLIPGCQWRLSMEPSALALVMQLLSGQVLLAVGQAVWSGAAAGQQPHRPAAWQSMSGPRQGPQIGCNSSNCLRATD